MPGEVRAEIGWRRALVDREMPSVLVARAQRGGGLMRIRVPLPGRFWLLTDPALIDLVLRTGATEFDKGGAIYRIIRTATGDAGLFVVNDPHTWRMLREHTNPAFAASNPGPLANECVRRLTDRIEGWPSTIDVFDEFKLLDVELLAHHLFGQSVDCANLIRLAQPIFDSQRKQWFRLGGGKYRHAIAALDAEVHSIIERRRLSAGDGDLLGHLLQARPELPAQRIRDQVVSHLMAGFDSTAFFDDVLAQRPSFPLIFRHIAADAELAGRRMRPGDQLFIALGPARLPFGTGKRKCIGEPVALLTGALSIAVLVQRFGHWQRTRPGNRQVRYATTAPPRHSAITFTR